MLRITTARLKLAEVGRKGSWTQRGLRLQRKFLTADYADYADECGWGQSQTTAGSKRRTRPSISLFNLSAPIRAIRGSISSLLRDGHAPQAIWFLSLGEENLRSVREFR